ncbi:hypothetical protein [Pseudoalteromonas denitrificans]|uniref:Uncharacterized protein n=1 Tax=Pseudoalteromonas denitrificans DSM 6059 TaxID=1123010 RepID=A0A1I1UZG2_9GAMM|nr:hypothetical protein [Pseudoalteromonas denitrificans]SFD76197.1 hypothetical protein SAMN02745724_05384 [Pseudoalteromonas denitrificans DSM 6059]
MKSTWFVFLFLTSHVLSFNATAMGNITYLNVIDEVVYFSTDKIKTSTPSCAKTANAEQWTVSLNNRTGRALYALLVTAMAAKQAISIESSGDCNHIDGIESAKGVTIATSGLNNQESEQIDTILSQAMEINMNPNIGIYINSTSGAAPSSQDFWVQEFGSSLGKFNLSFSGRRLIGHIDGSGWLTSILTPETYANDQSDKTVVEVIIDDINTKFTLKKQNESSRFLFGLTKQFDRSNFRQILKPVDVVSQGKGVYFENSLEVWITEGYIRPYSTGASRTAGFQYLLGKKNK